jgi:FkbM family methyltransferase
MAQDSTDTEPSAAPQTPGAGGGRRALAVWAERFMRMAAARRGGKLARRLDTLCVRYHETFENRDYDVARNGESRVLSVLGRDPWMRCVFDVGANIGDWTRLAARNMPAARIESFEIVGATHAILRRNCADLPQVTTHAFGLSDAEGTVDVFCIPAASALATCVAGITQSYHGLAPQTQRARVTTGDRFCAEQGVDRIDFLKIDVEGLESRVLSGFRAMLGDGRVRVIQFEYGYVNIAVKFLLKDFYELLRPLGFIIGKIYPREVEFRDYRYPHEDFIGPNFLAVHESQPELIAALATDKTR